MSNSLAFPIVVIGTGPVGLAAAAHLLRRGEIPLVFEAGSSVGASMLQWGHVRLFSPWRYLIDRAARVLLEEHNIPAPDLDAYPTGREVVEQYLLPLATVPDWLRTGALDCECARGRLGKRTPGGVGTAGDRGLFHRSWGIMRRTGLQRVIGFLL